MHPMLRLPCVPIRFPRWHIPCPCLGIPRPRLDILRPRFGILRPRFGILRPRFGTRIRLHGVSLVDHARLIENGVRVFFFGTWGGVWIADGDIQLPLSEVHWARHLGVRHLAGGVQRPRCNRFIAIWKRPSRQSSMAPSASRSDSSIRSASSREGRPST